MTEIPLNIRRFDDAAIARIDAAIEQHGLLTTMKGTLISYPGSTHWHCKLGNEPGTLEITLWPDKQRAWFKVQAGRRGIWIDEVIAKLKQSIES
jgi:hypothetical protein